MAGRIRRGEEFRRVFEAGRRRAQGAVVVYVLPTGGPTRAGFVCGRSVGGAVLRNRARRVLREAWRSLRARAREGYDIVLVARPEIRGMRTGEMAEQIEQALAAEGALRE